MSRRRRPPSPTVTPADRRRHVRDWRELAEKGLAAAIDPLGLPASELKTLGDLATTAGPAWAWPIDWPDGLAFDLLAVGVRAFCRGSDGLRDRLQGPLAGAARAVIDMLDDLAAADGEPGSAPAPASVEARLPYRED